MRQVDHFIAGDSPAPTRKHKIWNPSTGEVQAEVALGDANTESYNIIVSLVKFLKNIYFL